MRELLLDARSVLGERLEGGCRGEVMEYGRCLVQRKASREDDKWAGLRLGLDKMDGLRILHVTGPLVALQDLHDPDVLCLRIKAGPDMHEMERGPVFSAAGPDPEEHRHPEILRLLLPMLMVRRTPRPSAPV